MFTALLLMLLMPTADASSREERAEKLAEKAERLAREGDALGAFKAANRALKLDSRNVTALDVRGNLLYQLAAQGGENAERLMTAALEDLRWVAELEPTSLRGGIARDTVNAVVQPHPFPRTVAPKCPASSEESLGQAEAAFSRGQMDLARPAYEKALKECPENPDWWVYYGDIFFQAQNFEGARQQYQKALNLEPCNWMAHRFMSDAYLQQGRLPGGTTGWRPLGSRKVPSGG